MSTRLPRASRALFGSRVMAADDAADALLFSAVQLQPRPAPLRPARSPLLTSPSLSPALIARCVDTDTGNEHIFRRTCVCLLVCPSALPACLSVCSFVRPHRVAYRSQCIVFQFEAARVLSSDLFIPHCTRAISPAAPALAHSLPAAPLPRCPTAPLHSNLITQRHARSTLHAAQGTRHAARQRRRPPTRRPSRC